MRCDSDNKGLREETGCQMCVMENKTIKAWIESETVEIGILGKPTWLEGSETAETALEGGGETVFAKRVTG